MTPDEFAVRRHTFDRFIKDIFDYSYLVVVDTMHAEPASGAPSAREAAPVAKKGERGDTKADSVEAQFTVTHF